MAEPVLTDAAFPGGLHPGKGKTDRGTVTASTALTKGWPVKVVGHSGKKPTVWVGKVGDPTGTKDTWALVDLTVKHPKQRARDEKDRDAEDVSTTVTNSTTNEESQPVNTTGVPLVP